MWLCLAAVLLASLLRLRLASRRPPAALRAAAFPIAVRLAEVLNHFGLGTGEIVLLANIRHKVEQLGGWLSTLSNL